MQIDSKSLSGVADATFYLVKAVIELRGNSRERCSTTFIFIHLPFLHFLQLY